MTAYHDVLRVQRNRGRLHHKSLSPSVHPLWKQKSAIIRQDHQVVCDRDEYDLPFFGHTKGLLLELGEGYVVPAKLTSVFPSA